MRGLGTHVRRVVSAILTPLDSSFLIGKICI
nr:MAG TPA: hypothetical protein [Caudoviricetes sp.]